MGRGEPGCAGKEPGSGILNVGHLLAPQRCQEGLWMYFERGKYFRTSIKKYIASKILDAGPPWQSSD